MIRKDVHAVVRAFTKQYIHARKKEKSETLSRLVKTTGYSRKHLMEILPNPLTAYQRVLKRKDIPKETKQKLRIRYRKLNPKKLLLEITGLGKKLSER